MTAEFSDCRQCRTSRQRRPQKTAASGLRGGKTGVEGKLLRLRRRHQTGYFINQQQNIFTAVQFVVILHIKTAVVIFFIAERIGDIPCPAWIFGEFFPIIRLESGTFGDSQRSSLFEQPRRFTP